MWVHILHILDIVDFFSSRKPLYYWWNPLILLFSSLMLSSVIQSPYISPWILNIPESQSLNPSILILWIQSSMYSEKHSTSPSRKMKISHFSLIRNSLLNYSAEQHTINNYLSWLQMDPPSSLSSEVAKHFPIWAKWGVYVKQKRNNNKFSNITWENTSSISIQLLTL